MDLSVIVYLALLALVGLLRLAELRVSRRHQRELVGRGIEKRADPQFRWMVALHTAVLWGAAIEVVVLRRPFLPDLAAPMAVLFLLATGLRWWVIHTMGAHWNVEVMASGPLGVVTSGPFRWVRHPNYLAVFVELVALPLIHTAWITAFVAAAGQRLGIAASPQGRRVGARREPGLPRRHDRQASFSAQAVLICSGKSVRSRCALSLRVSRSARRRSSAPATGPDRGRGSGCPPRSAPPRAALRAPVDCGWRETFEAPQARLEQRARTSCVAPRVVMKGRCNLNDALQEGLFRLRRAQPDSLPRSRGPQRSAGC